LNTTITTDLNDSAMHVIRETATRLQRPLSDSELVHILARESEKKNRKAADQKTD
jgi:hypothetical protein